MSACLEENEIVDFVMRNLEPEEAARAEAHIDTCNACRAVLIELARVFELHASSMPAPEEEVSADEDGDVSEPMGLGLLPPELLKGSKVGRYMMLDLLGTGAMGVVFSAYDPELDRKVAVKVLRDRSRDAERNARMVREARATARLAHPNVVVVHDVGEFEGNVFMAMELVTGGTLGDWLKDQSRTRAEILDAFIEAGEGLAAAHAAGLVHRDFKPGNVLMGRNGRARVTDFGLARAGEPAETTQDDLQTLSGSLDDVAVTKTGALVGTPAYMSPEQFEGQLADPRSDQFSFCVALAEALTGRRPFEGKSLRELQLLVCTGKLRDQAFAGLSRPLATSLQRGLSLEPGDRHEDMQALLRILREVRGRAPAKTWARLGLVGVALLGGAGAAWAGDEPEAVTFETCKTDAPVVADAWTAETRTDLEATIASIDRPAAPRIAHSVVTSLDTYAADWAEAHAGACASDEELGLRFSQLRCLERGRAQLRATLQVLAEGDAVVLEHAEEAIRSLPQPQACATPGWRDTEPVEPPEAIRDAVEASRMDYEVARAYLMTGQYDDAARAAAAVVEEASALGFAPLTLDAMLVRADALSNAGRTDDAEAALRSAWTLAIRTSDARSQVRVASAMLDLLGAEKRQADDGAFWLDVSEAALERIDEDDPAAWEHWSAVARFRAYGGEYDAALEALERARTIPGVSFGQRLSTDDARLLVLSLRGDAEHKERLLAESAALAERLRTELGPDHPRLILVWNNHAGMLARLGRGEASLEAVNEAMRIATDVYAEDDPRMAGIFATRATSRQAMGDLEGARADAQRVVEIREANDSDDTMLGLAYNNLAAMEVGLHEFEASVEHMQKALPHLEAGFGAENINIANAHATLSSNLISLERYEDAREHLEAAQSIAASAGPMGAQLEPILALNLGRVELATGNLDTAASLLEQGSAQARTIFGEEHPILAKFLGVAAKVALKQGRFADAIEAAGGGLVVANDDATKGVLHSVRARAFGQQGQGVACHAARDAAEALGATFDEDPC